MASEAVSSVGGELPSEILRLAQMLPSFARRGDVEIVDRIISAIDVATFAIAAADVIKIVQAYALVSQLRAAISNPAAHSWPDDQTLPRRPFPLNLLEAGFLYGVLSARRAEPIADQLKARISDFIPLDEDGHHD